MRIDELQEKLCSCEDYSSDPVVVFQHYLKNCREAIDAGCKLLVVIDIACTCWSVRSESATCLHESAACEELGAALRHLLQSHAARGAGS